MTRIRPVFGLKNSPVVVKGIDEVFAALQMTGEWNHTSTAGNAEVRMRHLALHFGCED
jgi:hypothetical protein